MATPKRKDDAAEDANEDPPIRAWLVLDDRGLRLEFDSESLTGGTECNG